MKKFLIKIDQEDYDSNIVEAEDPIEAIVNLYIFFFGKDDVVAIEAICSAKDLHHAIELFNRLNDDGAEIELILDANNPIYDNM